MIYVFYILYKIYMHFDYTVFFFLNKLIILKWCILMAQFIVKHLHLFYFI